MSQAILEASIKAYDEFTDKFLKLQQELKKTEQAGKQVAVSTQTVNQSLSALVQAKARAREATEKFNKVLAEMARGGKQGADVTQRLDAAFKELVASERQVEQQTAKVNATLSAYNLTSKEAQAVIRQVDKALGDAGDQHARHGHQMQDNMMQTMALVSALYAMQQALLDVMQTGREFELTIKQTQAITGDFTSMLRDMAMESQGGNLDVHTPRELALAYRELGQAGASANEIMAATPGILEFGIASMLDTEKATYGVLAAAKSFNIALSEVQQVTDAYTEAMNLGALAGEDFQWIMSSAGAVAKLAGQDFREILSVGSVMRDAGVQAQDAGTSIKSALLALIAPSDEAREVIKRLGVDIYDASGRMKQWSEITAEFEKALAPFNEEGRQLALTTIFGSDGIRAMATSLNKGSDYLKNFTEELQDADGATRELAEAMADSLDGAIRRTNTSLERAKILLFEDMETGATKLLGAVNIMVRGFNALDESGRRLVEMLIGGAGLVVAITSLISVMRMLGITWAVVTGPIGKAVMAVTALTGAILTLKGAQENANQKAVDSAQHISKLKGQYEELKRQVDSGTLSEDEHRKTQEKLKTVMDDIAQIMPDIVTKWDEHGRAVEIDTRRLNENTEAQLRNVRTKAQNNVNNLYSNLFDQAEYAAKLQTSQGKAQFIRNYIDQYMGQVTFNPEPTSPERTKELLKEARRKAEAAWAGAIRDAESRQSQIAQEITSAQKILYPDAEKYDEKFKLGIGLTTGGYYEPGNKTGDKPFIPKDGDSKNPALEAAKKYIDDTTASLYSYRQATEAAANAIAMFGTKQEHLSQVIQSGKGTAYDAIELNKLRVEQYVKLSEQQDKLNKQTEGERKALDDLKQRYAKTTDSEAAKTLRQEIDRLTQSVFQSGQAWWQAEKQKLSLLEIVKQEEKRRYDDAYQKATDLMRHQVNMSMMSTEQQIEYLEKLRAAHAWSQQQMWDIEEDLFRLRRQQLGNYLDVLDEEYKVKLDSLDARTKASIKEIQDQIDSLDEQGNESSREEETRKHNQKLEDLQKQRRYHELRTGTEHKKAIAEIEQEIAEETRQWELQQQEWSREDQKANLQEKLEQVKEEAEEERKELEDHYRKAQRIAEEGIMDVIAALAATEPKWMETGKQLIDALIAGLESGDFSSVESRIDQVKNENRQFATPDVPGSSGSGGTGSISIPLWTISPGAYKMVGGTSIMASRDLAALLGLSADWDNSSGMVKIGGKTFAPLRQDGGKSYVSIRDVAEAFGYKVTWNDPNVEIYRAAAGGLFHKPALSFLAEAGESEVAIPLSRFQPMMNEAVLVALQKQGQDQSALERAADRIVAAIESRMGVNIQNLLNIESFENNDGADVGILANDLRRAVAALS